MTSRDEFADTVAGKDAVAASSPAAGPEIVASRYEVLGLLGVGGMGSVYRARDARLDELVALKFLRPEYVDTPGMRSRFHDEVRLARRVTHRNVARTFDIGEHEGGLFMTMELVDGESLGRRIEREQVIAQQDALAIASQIIAALGAAHEAGVVHRDLKPDNVLLAKDGRVVVSDFGIARAHIDGDTERAEGIVGTPGYMAPEQVEAGDIDGRADLYALGEILYEMLTGAPAWSGDDVRALMNARLVAPPPDPRAVRPEIPEDLAAIVVRLLARRREGRFPTAADVAAAVTGLAKHGAEPARRADAYPPALERSDRTVAVLPLQSEGLAAYVVSGVLEDFVDTLAMTRGLRVRPIGVTSRYAGDPRSAREIGRELGVQVVVSGSIRAAGEDLRMTARALSVEDDFQIAACRLEKPAASILQMADEAARAIAEALTAEHDLPAREAPVDARAADTYLRARAELRASWHASDRIRRVAEHFDEAVALAPRHAHVLAGAALAHARVAFFAEGDRAKASAEIARDLADRAIALAPQLGEAWIALATVRLDAGEVAASVRALQSALRVSPKTAKPREMLGRILLEAGDVTQAISLLEDALALDTSNEDPRWDLARAYALRGDALGTSDLLAGPAASDAGEAMRAWLTGRFMTWQPRERWPTARIVERLEEGIVWHVAGIYRRFLVTGALTSDDRGFFTDLARDGGARIRLLAMQQAAELAVAEGRPALPLVTEAVAAGLRDLAWMDLCPVLAPLRTDPAWPALRAHVDARARPVLAASRD